MGLKSWLYLLVGWPEASYLIPKSLDFSINKMGMVHRVVMIKRDNPFKGLDAVSGPL